MLDVDDPQPPAQVDRLVLHIAVTLLIDASTKVAALITHRDGPWLRR